MTSWFDAQPLSHVNFSIFTILTGDWKVSWIEMGREEGTGFRRTGLLGWVTLSWLICPTRKTLLSGFYGVSQKGVYLKIKAVKVLCLFQRRHWKEGSHCRLGRHTLWGLGCR